MTVHDPATTLKGPRPDPKIFGNQVGVPVGKTWGFRIGASQDGIHSPVVAGISGSVTDGAWSIALSGGYEDVSSVPSGFYSLAWRVAYLPLDAGH